MDGLAVLRQLAGADAPAQERPAAPGITDRLLRALANLPEAASRVSDRFRGVDPKTGEADYWKRGGLAGLLGMPSWDEQPKTDIAMGFAGSTTPAVKGIAGGLAAPTKGIRAYHGSPHDFDRFDLSKIGTGEGGSSFGRGIYFSEDPRVAEIYRKAGERDASGRVYETNLNAVPDELLGWTAPISGQSKIIKEAAARLPAPVAKSGMPFGNGGSLVERDGRWFLRTGGAEFRLTSKDMDRMFGDGNLTGENVYRRAASELGEQEVSDRLRQSGVKGIQYPDENYRAGATNYVVFDDKLISILRKYGLLGPMAGGAVAGATGDY